MNANDIVRDVEPLTHAARVAWMIALGKRAATEADVAASLAELAARGWYERFIALYACFGSRNSAQVLQALADPSRVMRGLAARLAVQVCDATQLQQALTNLPRQVWRPLLWKLWQKRLFTIIDAFLARLAEQDDAQFCQLLAFGSAQAIARHAPRFRLGATWHDWLRLARFHPTTTQTLLAAWLTESTTASPALTAVLNAVLPLLARTDAEGALTLVRAYGRSGSLSAVRLQPLANRIPEAVVDLLLAQPDLQLQQLRGLTFQQVVGRLRVEQIVALNERFPASLGYRYDWLRRIAPERREAVFAVLANSIHQRNHISKAVLDSLPRALREREARREMARPGRSSTLTYACYLPWDEMLAIIEPALHDSDSAMRTAALQTLIDATRYHPSHLGDILGPLQARRTERDTVRNAMLSHLAALPPSRWQPAHLPALAAVIRHGLNDVGLSQNTQRQIMTLVMKLAPFHLEWSAAQLATIVRERGFVAPSHAPSHLSHHQLTTLLVSMLPIMHIWVEQEKEDAMLELAEYCAQAGTLPPTMLDLLLAQLPDAASVANAERMVRVLTRFDRARAQAAMGTLLQSDARWITVPAVAVYVRTYRQDILTPLLRLQAYTGHFDTGRRQYLLPMPTRFTTGTANQQEIFATTLMELVRDATQEIHRRTGAIMQLVRLPGIAPDRLIALSSDENTLLRTTALLALSRMDAATGLPTLIAALQDSRGRIAIHVIRAYLRAMPIHEALAILRAIPRERVTVTKEVVRIIGEWQTPAAFQELLAWEPTDLHRDVRIVLLQSLWRYPTQAAIWPIFEHAARASDVDLAIAAMPSHAFLLETARLDRASEPDDTTLATHLLRLLGISLEHAETRVRYHALQRCGWLSVPDIAHIIIPRLVAMVRVAKDAAGAEPAKALIHLSTAADLAVIVQVFAEKMPDRAAIQAVVKDLVAADDGEKQRLLPLGRAVLATLATDPILLNLRIDLALAYLPASEWVAFLQTLAADNLLHVDAQAQIQTALSRNWRKLSLTELAVIERALAASDDARLRRIAFMLLLTQTTTMHRWEAPQRQRLQAYRNDASPLVAAVAQFTFIPKAENEGGE